MTDIGINGAEIGRNYFKRVEAYLNGLVTPPLLSSGAINFSIIARESGVPRQSLYKNPAIRDLIEALKLNHQGTSPKKELRNKSAKVLINLDSSSSNSQKKRDSDKKVHQLEQKNAALFSENMELRRQIKELKMEIAGAELMIESGRRVLF
nr:hypothetical protein [uncultured Undibacterium sp.]